MPNDIDRTVMRVDEQMDWSGGMNLIDAPNKIGPTQARIIRNFDIRNGTLKKMRGHKPDSRLEIGAFYYDRFGNEELDENLWSVVSAGAGADLSISSEAFNLQGATSANAWDVDGLITQTINESEVLSYTEFEIKTPAVRSSLTRLRIQLSPTKTTLESDNGLDIEFDESGDVILREDGSETDTTFNWVVASTYRIRIEKSAEGWKGSISLIPALTSSTPTVPTTTTLFTAAFEGHLVNYVHYQVYGGLWILDNIVTHEGFESGARSAANGVVRFYRETEENETIVFANNKIYKRDSFGYNTLKTGVDLTAKWKTAVRLDQLIMCNGVDATMVYDGSNVSDLGTGVTKAPIAAYVIVHLQTTFLAGDPAFPNSLYRQDVLDGAVWDDTIPLVDVDAWNGDIITGFVKLGPSLFIIKSSSVWELVGTTNINFQLRRVLGAQGSIAPYSIADNGVVAFWRGPNGIFRFDGIKTTLISYTINPMFEPTERSLYPTTVFNKDEGSVGVIHDNKYRCAVVQHGEGAIDKNNFEYVFDFIAGEGRGAWMQRSDRYVSMYSVWTGQGDDGELFFVPSDTSNTLFRAEIEDGNTRHDFNEVAIFNLYDTPFVGKVLSRHFTANLQGRQHLDKHWNPWHLHYEPVGNIDIGLKLFTARNPTGELFAVTMQKKLTPKNLTDGIPLAEASTEDKAYPLVAGDYEEKKRESMGHSGDKNQGVEIWYEITQAAELRTLSGFTGVGQRLGVGNFEPARIRRVGFAYKEGNL